MGEDAADRPGATPPDASAMPRPSASPREGALLPGEVRYHFKALLAILFANASAYPFDLAPLGLPIIAILCLLTLLVRLHAPRTGDWPRRIMYAVLILSIPLMVGMGIGRGPSWLVTARLLGIFSLVIMLTPPEWGWTNMGCTLSLMTLAASGLMRTDLSYAFCLGGFLLCTPGLYAFGHIHESLRVHRLALAPGDAGTGLGERTARRARYGLELCAALVGGLGVFAILPKPALMPLGALRTPGPASMQMDRLAAGRGLAARGGVPILLVQGPEPMYLAGQMFDRYAGGEWSRTPATEAARMSRQGIFDLPVDVAGQDEEWAGGATSVATRRHARIVLLSELPDLLPIPQGTRRLTMPSWHLLGRPPWYAKAWSSTPLTSYAVEYVPPLSLAATADERLPALTRQVPRPREPASAGGSSSGGSAQGGSVRDAGRTVNQGRGTPALGGPVAIPADAPERSIDPALDPRVVELARSVTAGATGPIGRVLAIQRWLEDHCTYDLSASTPEGSDPLVSFLLETRRGFCEHFATALAVMARVAGVPTRLVTGYLADEVAPARWGMRGFVARARDAHAWAQVFVEGHGWILVDPTQGGSRAGFWERGPDWMQEDVLAAPATSGDAGQTWLARAIVPLVSRAVGAIGRHRWLASGLVALICALTGLAVWWWGEGTNARRARTEVVQELAGAGALRPSGARGAGGDVESRHADSPAEVAEFATMTRHELAMRFDRVCVMAARVSGRERLLGQTPLEYARDLAGQAVPLAPALPGLLLDLAADLTRVLLAPPGNASDALHVARRLDALASGLECAAGEATRVGRAQANRRG